MAVLPTVSTETKYPFGYAKFKTPYYKITIATPHDKVPVALPDQIHKLVQRVEIVENYISNSCVFENFTIVFTEGSREPYRSEHGVDTSSLYSTSSNPGDTLTNRPGLLTDLRFTKKNGTVGITALNKVEEITAIDSSNLNSETTPTTLNIQNKPTYLFQEGNIVTIEWGYVEDPDKVRIIANVILMTQTDFPENGQPTTSIICQSPVALLDQISTPVGKTYKGLGYASFTETGKLKVSYSDISSVALLQNFCTKHGIEANISSSIINDTLNKGALKTWIAGHSFIQFITELAKRANCVFRVYINPKNNYKYTLEFINKVAIEKKITIPSSEEYLLTYKGLNSILKSVSIRADFAGLPNTAFTGLNSSGKLHASQSSDGKDQVVQQPGTLFIGSDPGSKGATPASISSTETNTSQTSIQTTTNKVSISPMADDIKVLDNSSLAAFARCGNKQITIEFTTLGYTQLMAGQIVKFSNIGDRYSNRYHVYTVIHTLDSNGYNCRGTAFGLNLGGSTGIVPGKAQKEETPPTTEPVQQFSGSSTPSDPVDKSRGDRFKNTSSTSVPNSAISNAISAISGGAKE